MAYQVWASNEHGIDTRYEPEDPADVEEQTMPCFNCNSTHDTDPETSLCRSMCYPQHLSTCKGNICPVLALPEDFEEF